MELTAATVHLTRSAAARTAVVAEMAAAAERYKFMWRALSFALFLGLATGIACAREKVMFGEDEFDAHLLKSFTEAVGALPIDPKDGDQVRVWFEDVMGGHVQGYFVTSKGAWHCKLRYDNTGKALVVNRGDCAGPHRYAERIARPMALLAEAAKFRGKVFECGVMDGWQAEIEGIVDGKPFRFSAANTGECKGEEIEWVDNFLDTVAMAWFRKDPD
jgi:hypothetical protein